MPEKAIIDTATRVVKRVTSDSNPGVSATETVVDITAPIDFSTGYKKINAKGKVVAASDKDVDDADVDETKLAAKARKRMKDVSDAVDAVIAAGATPATLVAYFTALKKTL